MPSRFLASSLVHERPPERVVRELVRRRKFDERAELGLGLFPSADAKICDAESLAYRARLRFAALGFLERDGRLGRHAAP